MINYTTGNWAVSDLYTDTTTAAKSLSIPDLNYKVDYCKIEDEPTEAIIANKTSTELVSPETIRFGVSQVADVYNGVPTDASAKLASKRGVQTLVELTETYRAINSVTGDEYDIPCKGRLVLRFPNSSCVTQALITDLMTRVISAAFKTGSTDASRVLEIAKNSLLPDTM